MLETVIFIGRSGCGKGTQASLLRDYIHERDYEKRKILDIETGERFRQFIREENYSAKLSKKIYDAGLRQPNFLGTYMWSCILLEQLEEEMHIFFDGVGRSRPEAEMLTGALEFYKREKPKVIYLDVSRKWSEEKLLKRGRMDDTNLEKIDARLDWFDKDVMPAVEYFKITPAYTFVNVNGEQTVEEVHREILKAFER